MVLLRLPITLIIVLACGASSARAAVDHVPIKSDLVLKPGESYTAAIAATEPVEIGWQTVQAKACSTSCIEATDLTGGMNETIATPFGASRPYTPQAGRIAIQYKNISNEPVTINVFRVSRTCEAEACRFLDPRQKGRWLVFKVDQFTSITTSKDDSYSAISGVTLGGEPFTFKAVWWTDDKKALLVNCAPFVKRYVDAHTPKDQYSPYVISGQAIGGRNSIVLNAIDTCAPKAPKFGVPDANVFK